MKTTTYPAKKLICKKKTIKVKSALSLRRLIIGLYIFQVCRVSPRGDPQAFL